jgi:hypothetical protein
MVSFLGQGVLLQRFSNLCLLCVCPYKFQEWQNLNTGGEFDINSGVDCIKRHIVKMNIREK